MHVFPSSYVHVVKFQRNHLPICVRAYFFPILLLFIDWENDFGILAHSFIALYILVFLERIQLLKSHKLILIENVAKISNNFIGR